MVNRPCLEPSCPRIGRGSRCAEHARQLERAKAARRPAMRTYAETERRRQAVAAHVAAFGWWCPGWRRPGHPSMDLTADHLDPPGAGGPEHGPLRVLCRACNGARGARPL
jgi:5-methylcytosine-specific restriction protein A